MNGLLTSPAWKRGDLTDRIGNHCYAESIYEREVLGVLQVIERIRLRGFETQDIRPTYRLVEVVNGKPRIIFIEEFLKDARRRADHRSRALQKRSAR